MFLGDSIETTEDSVVNITAEGDARVPGNPLIKGTFWLDDVKILPAASAAADH